MERIALLLLLISGNLYAAQAPWVGTDLKGLPCQGGGQGYGPYDYIKTSHRPQIPIVEIHHLTPNVINHIKGQEGTIQSDLDYTLRAVPNHHEALLSTIRYQLKLNNKLLVENGALLSPVECYLQRAIHFSPDDAASYTLFAYYLRATGYFDRAEKIYQKAMELSPDNPKIEYSYSELLIDLKRYDEATFYAKRAYQHGNPPKSLKNKLKKLKAWADID